MYVLGCKIGAWLFVEHFFINLGVLLYFSLNCAMFIIVFTLVICFNSKMSYVSNLFNSFCVLSFWFICSES
jgi:hypothetical protein